MVRHHKVAGSPPHDSARLVQHLPRNTLTAPLCVFYGSASLVLGLSALFQAQQGLGSCHGFEVHVLGGVAQVEED
jgi:hypothetical protein